MKKEKPSHETPLYALTRLAWPAILTGAIADLLLSMLMSIGLVYLFMQTSGLSGAGTDTLDQAFRTSPFYWVSLVLGVLISGLGGGIAGWLAPEEHHLHGLMAAFLTNVVYTFIATWDTPFTLVEFAGSMFGLLLGMVGGWLAGIVKARVISS